MRFDSRSACHLSLKNRISVIDQKLLSLQPIYEMSRLPRSVSLWKVLEIVEVAKLVTLFFPSGTERYSTCSLLQELDQVYPYHALPADGINPIRTACKGEETNDLFPKRV